MDRPMSLLIITLSTVRDCSVYLSDHQRDDQELKWCYHESPSSLWEISC